MSSFEMLGKDPRNTVIKVIGVGGGGGNAVQYMVDQGADGIELIAANTDHQALAMNKAHVLLQLGESGLGAGADPAVGAQAAVASAERIRDAVVGAHLLFITAGMGGGTGTGAAPVIAKIAKEEGILTVGVVTKPFSYEGGPRMRRAEEGIENLKQYVDSLIIILNDRLEDEFGEDATMEDCFNAANDVLYKACHGIAEIIHTPGVINVDFRDLSTVMRERGTALMGSATASGPDRAEKAATQAVSCPLLEGTDLHGARGLLVYVTASNSLKLSEPRKVMKILEDFVSPGANVIMGSARDDSMGDELRVTIVATGLDRPLSEEEKKRDGMRPDTEGTAPSNPWDNIFRSADQQSAPAPKAEEPAAPQSQPVKPEPRMPEFVPPEPPAPPAPPAEPPRPVERVQPAEPEPLDFSAIFQKQKPEQAAPATPAVQPVRAPAAPEPAPDPEPVSQPAKAPSPSVWGLGFGEGSFPGDRLKEMETPAYIRDKDKKRH